MRRLRFVVETTLDLDRLEPFMEKLLGMPVHYDFESDKQCAAIAIGYVGGQAQAAAVQCPGVVLSNNLVSWDRS